MTLSGLGVVSAGGRRPESASELAAVGRMYLDGLGVPVDAAKAAACFQRAADAGDVGAMVQWADCLVEGVDGAVDKNEAEAVPWLQRAADAGDAVAMSKLAWCYSFGHGVAEADPVQGLAWNRKAAALGNAAAMIAIGHCYRDGDAGLEKDAAEAFAWFSKAAEAAPRNGNALVMVGLCYANGWGVEKDYAVAVQWYRKAAARGQHQALFNMGLCYDQAHGVDRDEEEALRWYRRAAQAGYPPGMHKVGVHCDSTDRPEEAVRWYRHAAARGYAPSMFYLGISYREGTGVPKDDAQAAEWYRKAADAGHPPAMANLGYAYENGHGVPEDPHEAVRWYTKAADLGDIRGMRLLAHCYLSGQGVPEDTSRAIEIMKRAVSLDDTEATKIYLAQCYICSTQYDDALAILQPLEATAVADDHVFCKLGELHQNGLGVPVDAARAAALFRRSGQSCPSALVGLALCYELGEGVPGVDKAEAVRLYREAAAKQGKTAEARCIEFGWGTHGAAGASPAPADPAAAVPLYAAQADKNDQYAGFFLGQRYELGWPGTPPDLAAARRCYAKAVEDGSWHARQALARLDAAAP